MFIAPSSRICSRALQERNKETFRSYEAGSWTRLEL